MKIIDDKGRLFGVINIFDAGFLFAALIAILLTIKWITTAEDPSWVKLEQRHVKFKCDITISKSLIELVNEGDVLLDDDGKPIGRIDKIISIEPVQTASYISKDGEKIFITDSGNVVLNVIADMMVYEKNKKLYPYNDNISHITGGSNIAVKTDRCTLSLKIIETLE